MSTPQPQHGAANGKAKLTDKQVHQIRALAALGGLASQRDIAAHFGLSQSTVHGVLSGRLWAALPPSTTTPVLVPVRIALLDAEVRAKGGLIAGPGGVRSYGPADPDSTSDTTDDSEATR